MCILSTWEKNATATLGQLHEFFGEMDRWNIQEDMENILYDVCRLERDGRLQFYDAFLLYADEDVDFAMEMVSKLENEYNLKLCYKDRDLIGGLNFEHEAIMRLIAERCQRLVIIVTSSFLNSPANKFFVTFAQALGIEQRQRKVIPCIYERCSLPVELSYYFPLDYNRSSKLWNFWDKLRNSISVANISSLPARATIRELSAEHSPKMIEMPSTQLKSTSKPKSVESPLSPSSQRSWSSTSSTTINDDISLKKFSDISVTDKKGKPKRFFDKIFSLKDGEGKKAAKKSVCNNSSDNPTMCILSTWEKNATATLGQLHEFFGEMDRWNIQEDMENILYDVCRLERDGRLQFYDAFLLYADEDVDFAMEMVSKLENEYNLKLCYKDRDLIGGLNFEHEAIMRLIAERCQRLVIIVTSSFFNSPANKFFVTFAQALGIEQRQRKVIPCIYERCSLPVELSYYFPLDYNRSSKLWNFWDKLRNSISVANISSLSARATIRELSAEHSPKMIEMPSTQLTSTSKPKSVESPLSPSSQRSWSSTSSTTINDDISLKKFSDISVTDKKGKPKRFFDKIFSLKDGEGKKAAKKKLAGLEQ